MDLYHPEYHPTGGESWDMFHDRVAIAWQEITARAATVRGDLVVVSHALVCRSLLERHLTLGEDMDSRVPRWPNRR